MKRRNRILTAGLKQAPRPRHDLPLDGQALSVQADTLPDAVARFGRQLKQAEAAASESARRLAGAQRISHVGSWQWIPSENRIVWSDEMFRLFDLSPAEFDGSTAAAIRAFHPDDRAMVEEATRKTVAERTPQVVECRVLRRDGAITWVRGESELVFSDDGSLASMSGTYQDVTERRRSDAALRASEIRYRRLFEAAQDGILILDADTRRVIDVNPFLVKLLGYTREEIQGKQLWEIGLFRDVAAARERFTELQTQGYVRYEDLPLVTVGGRQANVEFVSNLYSVDDQPIIQCNIRDITERKQVEVALRREKEFSAAVLDNMVSGVVACDESGKLVLFNRAAREWHGQDAVDTLQEEWAGRYNLYCADAITLLPSDANPLARAFNGEVLHDAGLAIRAQGQPARHVLANSAPFFDEQGLKLGAVVVMHDITVHRQTEEVLRESEAKFRSYVEHAPLAVFVADHTGRYVEVNRGAEELLGYDSASLLRLSIADVVYDQDLEAAMQAFAEVDRQGCSEGTFRMQRQDGALVWVQVRAVRLGADRMMAYCQDVTQARQTTEALEASEERLRRALTAADQGIFTLDLRTGEATISPEFARVMGYGAEELQKFTWGERIHPDDRKRVSLMAQERHATGHDDLVVELRMATKTGDWRWVLMRGQLVAGAGQGGQVIGTIMDVDERRQTQEALLQAQKTESLGVLAGGVAHDFNNLLVALLGQTSLAQAKLPPESAAREPIEKAVSAAQRAADLTRQLLAYSGRGHFAVQPLRLNALILENLGLLEVAIPKHIHLRSELAGHLPLIQADVGQIQQVLMNLIINGAEAIGSRPGVVTIRTGQASVAPGDPPIWRNFGEPLPVGPYVVLEVSDDGAGMDAETMRRIFDPFFTTKFTGRGLGLAAVIGIVKGHRGGLRVESTPGEGTTFHLAFPACAEEESLAVAAVPAPAAAAPASGAEDLILLIDDEEPVREAVTDILAMRGIRVLAAPNGTVGLALYAEHQAAIRLVLLDLSMPGLSGEETFHRLRVFDPQVRIILSSGYDESEVTARFAGQALTGFLQKPYNMEALTSAIRRHLAPSICIDLNPSHDDNAL